MARFKRHLYQPLRPLNSGLQREFSHLRKRHTRGGYFLTRQVNDFPQVNTRHRRVRTSLHVRVRCVLPCTVCSSVYVLGSFAAECV